LSRSAFPRGALDAEKLLVKCPSKYQGLDQKAKHQARHDRRRAPLKARGGACFYQWPSLCGRVSVFGRLDVLLFPQRARPPGSAGLGPPGVRSRDDGHPHRRRRAGLSDRTHDFRIHYVFSYSDLSLPTRYLVATLWAGQEGSFLLWLVWGMLVGLPLIRYAQHYEDRTMVVYTSRRFSLLLFLLRQSPFRFISDLTAARYLRRAGAQPTAAEPLDDDSTHRSCSSATRPLPCRCLCGCRVVGTPLRRVGQGVASVGARHGVTLGLRHPYSAATGRT